MIESTAEKETAYIARTRAGGSVVLAPAGALTFAHCPDLERALDSAAAGHPPEVILDGGMVSLMDSEALELLLKTHEALAERGGSLKLINLNDVCRDILVVTRLVNTLRVYEDLGAAIRNGR